METENCSREWYAPSIRAMRSSWSESKHTDLITNMIFEKQTKMIGLELLKEQHTAVGRNIHLMENNGLSGFVSSKYYVIVSFYLVEP